MGLHDETTSYKLDERSPGSVISDLGSLTNNVNGDELEKEGKQGSCVEKALETNGGFSCSDAASADVSNAYSSGGGEKKPVLIVVMGVAGTGKTTLAKALASNLNLPYIEGDDLHPPENIHKMSSGVPLTDQDREPWLKLIRKTAEDMVVEQQRGDGEKGKGVMVTCSALKKYYRDILRGMHELPERTTKSEPELESKRRDSPEALLTYFVYIQGDDGLLRERMRQRTGHFMKPEMLDSQLATLEDPEGEEGVVVVSLAGTTKEQVEEAVQGLEAIGAK